jgi:hypothetical protein
MKRKNYLAVLAIAAVGLSASGTALAGLGQGIEASQHNFSNNRGTIIWDGAGNFESWGHIGCNASSSDASAWGNDQSTATKPTTSPGGTRASDANVWAAINQYAELVGTREKCEAQSGVWNGGVNRDGWARGEVCRVCHSPHDHGKDYYEAGLLWNRQASEVEYTLYTSATFSGGNYGQPTGISQKCLSCHDGSIGMDTRYGLGGLNMANDWGRGNARTRIPGQSNNVALNDLRGVHPISVDYPAEACDTSASNKCIGVGGYHDPETTEVGGAAGSGATFSGMIKDVLEESSAGTLQVQCSSCHDVHDSVGKAVGGSRLLRVAQNEGRQGGERASGLCLTCHNK